jgi:hypothetical protein
MQDHSDIRQENARNFADARYASTLSASDIRREAAEYSAQLRKEVAEDTSTIRRETATSTGEIMKEGAKGTFDIRGDVKDTRYDIATRVHADADKLGDQATQFYIASQKNATDAATGLATLNTLQGASTAAIAAAVAANGEKVATANALEAAKNAAASMLESCRNTTTLSMGQASIIAVTRDEGDRTRALINDLKYHDLNRALVERNAELVEERESRRHHRDRADQYQSQGQWAVVQAQLQAFQSQFQQATQGTVNFGSMSGNAGRNTSTNNIV